MKSSIRGKKAKGGKDSATSAELNAGGLGGGTLNCNIFADEGQIVAANEESSEEKEGDEDDEVVAEVV